MKLGKENSNKNDLKWIEGSEFGVLSGNEFDDDTMLNLSLFKNSNVYYDVDNKHNFHDLNFDNLKGYLEHSPQLITSPDSYYIDDDRKLIVGYEHFSITSTHENKDGAKADESIGRIRGKRIPTYESPEKIPYFLDGKLKEIKNVTAHFPDKEKLRGVSKLPWWIEGDVIHRSNLNIFEDDVVFPEFNYISEENIVNSIVINSKKHMKKYERYIENLKSLNGGYRIKFNFVLDMSNVVIPSVKVLASDNDYVRLNNIVFDGLQRVLKESREVLVDMLSCGSYVNDVGLIIIVPNAISTSSAKDIILFYVDDYFLYHFKSIDEIDKFTISKYFGEYKADDKYKFQQSMYSHYSNTSKVDKLIVSHKVHKNNIVLKKGAKLKWKYI